MNSDPRKPGSGRHATRSELARLRETYRLTARAASILLAHYPDTSNLSEETRRHRVNTLRRKGYLTREQAEALAPAEGPRDLHLASIAALLGARRGMPVRRLYGLPPWIKFDTTLDGRQNSPETQIRAKELAEARRLGKGLIRLYHRARSLCKNPTVDTRSVCVAVDAYARKVGEL